MRTFILGTDWWTDCDDAVAIRMLARAHKAGEITLAGIGINACMPYSVPALDGFLHAEGVDDISLGIDLEATDFTGTPPFQKRLASLCKRYPSNEAACDAVRLYRQILHDSQEKVEIVEIGFMQVIANVLKSEPDDVSPLSGMELVREKVAKMWVMAGKWDEENGVEHNFANNRRACEAAQYFCAHCPVPITFLGFEIGYDVISGGELAKDDALYQVLCDHGSFNGRSSWDPMLALLALVGDEEKAGYKTVRGTATVDAATGANNFAESEDGKHVYVIKKYPNDKYVEMIHERIL